MIQAVGKTDIQLENFSYEKMVLLFPQKLTIPQTPNSALEDKLVTINSTYITDALKYLEERHCSRTIVVGDELVSQSDRLDKLLTALGHRCLGKQVVVADDGPLEDVIGVAQLLSDTDADSIICMGTQRSADIVKIARLLCQCSPTQELNEEILKSLVGPGATLRPPSIKLIRIPQTLSLAEYDPVSIIKNNKGQDFVFGRQDCVATLPNLILLDPELVLDSCASETFLLVGARAIDQACETLCCQSTEEQGLTRARSGLRALIAGLSIFREQVSIGQWTETSPKSNKRRKKSADDSRLKLLRAVSNCQQGIRDVIAGVACYGSTLGSSHAISQALHSATGVPLEVLSCIILPAVLSYENPGAFQGREWRIVNQHFILDTINETLSWREKSASTAMSKFFQYLGLSTRLSAVGIRVAPAATSSKTGVSLKDEQGERRVELARRPEIFKQVARKVVDEGDWMGGSKQIHQHDVVFDILDSVR